MEKVSKYNLEVCDLTFDHNNVRDISLGGVY
jgi:hypothetical protein